MADLTVMAVLKKLGKDILGWVKSNCVNNLVSTATNLPLAANQGKVLDEKIDEINQSLDGVSLYLSSIHNVDQLKAYRQNQLITITGKFVAKSGIDGGNTELFKINDTQIAVNDTLILGVNNTNGTLYQLQATNSNGNISIHTAYTNSIFKDNEVWILGSLRANK